MAAEERSPRHCVNKKYLFLLDEPSVKIQDSNMVITARFLKFLAVDKKCLACGRWYLAATEEENPGVCGTCITAAFPSPMEEEGLPLHQEVREVQL